MKLERTFSWYSEVIKIPKRRRIPSIFEEMMKRMRREMERGFRFFEEEEPEEENFWGPFEDMMKSFSGEVPEEFSEFVTEEETPQGKIRRYGPFVYGFSYSKKPGEEPQIQEFGNLKPGARGEIKPSPKGEREPLTEVVDLNDSYEVTVEVPGVTKEEIKLSATEERLNIETTGERKYTKELSFEDSINPEKIDATFRNGVLTIKADKREKKEEKGKEIDIK